MSTIFYHFYFVIIFLVTILFFSWVLTFWIQAGILQLSLLSSPLSAYLWIYWYLFGYQLCCMKSSCQTQFDLLAYVVWLFLGGHEQVSIHLWQVTINQPKWWVHARQSRSKEYHKLMPWNELHTRDLLGKYIEWWLPLNRKRDSRGLGRELWAFMGSLEHAQWVSGKSKELDLYFWDIVWLLTPNNWSGDFQVTELWVKPSAGCFPLTLYNTVQSSPA